MDMLLDNTFLQYLFFSAIFLAIFKFLENKFLIFSKITKVIRNKLGSKLSGLFYILMFPISGTFIESYFTLNKIQSHILFAFGISILCLLVDTDVKASK